MDSGSRLVVSSVSAMDSEFRLVGSHVSAVRFSDVGPYIVLELTGTDIGLGDYVLQVDGLSHLAIAGEVIWLDPSTGPDPTWLRLLGTAVTAASTTPDGTIRLGFSDDSAIEIGPEPYEPWQLIHIGGTSIVSVAGGGLARIERG